MASESIPSNNADTDIASHFFMLPSFILSLIERVLNQVLILDPLLSDKLIDVKHKRLIIEVRDWQQHIQLVFSGQHLHLHTAHSNDESDCMISADIDTLLALKNPAMLTQFIRQDKLDLQGDLHIAQGYSGAFSSIDIDWPEQFSKYIGDAPAQQLYSQLKAASQHGHKMSAQLSTLFTRLCQDELAITIHPLELAQFKQQNREVKNHVAALEQRIAVLTRTLS
jgi:ubiquinone biosynthesis protein UbiJ